METDNAVGERGSRQRTGERGSRQRGGRETKPTTRREREEADNAAGERRSR